MTAPTRPDRRLAARWLARIAPFSDWPATSLDLLLERVELPAGAILYRQGNESDALYVLAQGRLEVLTLDETGRERMVNTLGPGAVCGDSAFLREIPRLATARAATDTVLFALRRGDFEALRRQAEQRPAGTPEQPATPPDEEASPRQPAPALSGADR